MKSSLRHARRIDRPGAGRPGSSASRRYPDQRRSRTSSEVSLLRLLLPASLRTATDVFSTAERFVDSTAFDFSLRPAQYSISLSTFTQPQQSRSKSAVRCIDQVFHRRLRWGRAGSLIRRPPAFCGFVGACLTFCLQQRGYRSCASPPPLRRSRMNFRTSGSIEASISTHIKHRCRLTGLDAPLIGRSM